MYKTIDGNGRELLRLCQAGELRILNGLSWPGGPALDPSPTRPPTYPETSDNKRSSFQATVDLMRRLAASSFQFALQFVSNNLHLDSTARGGDESGSVLDYVVASSSVIAQVRSLEVLSLDTTLSDHRPVCFSWEGRPLSFDGSSDSGDLQTPDCAKTPKVLGWRSRDVHGREMQRRDSTLERTSGRRAIYTHASA